MQNPNLTLLLEPLSIEWQARHDDEHKIRRDDHRSPYQRDRARILHSAAFRRLQAKTQVHGNSVEDFHRSRLTHSLEAAQLGTGIVAQLKRKQPEFRELLPSDSLIDSLCLAHDIGHPPYGHGGEAALNYMMREYGGFEGNAQTFRIVAQLEPYTEHFGMNLSRRTLLGLIKYPSLISALQAKKTPDSVSHQRKLKVRDWQPAKGIYDCDQERFEWVLAPLSDHDKALLRRCRYKEIAEDKHNKTQFKSFDCSIMELADDIAYGVHDLEDAIELGMVTLEQWNEGVVKALEHSQASWVQTHIASITQMLFSGQHHQRKDAIGGMVNALLTSISIQKVKAPFESPLLAWNAKLEPQMAEMLDVLKNFVYHYVIYAPQVQIVEYRGQQIIMDIFEALSSDPERLLPLSVRHTWLNVKGERAQIRVIADYISSMTDGHAQRLHRELFSSVVL